VWRSTILNSVAENKTAVEGETSRALNVSSRTELAFHLHSSALIFTMTTMTCVLDPCVLEPDDVGRILRPAAIIWNLERWH
jgi:hypothetical protein